MATSVMLSTTSAAAGERDYGLPELELLEAPPARVLPEELPEQVRQPDGSWLLPPELAGAIEERLVDYRRYPEKCAVVIRAQAELGETRVAQALKVATSRCVADHVRRRAKNSGGVPMWQVGLITAGGVAGGVLIGIVVGVLAGAG